MTTRAVVDVPPESSPVLSICMVLFRGGELALAALDAVVRGTDVPYEVIVVDNCSPEGSGALVRAGTRGVRFIFNENNVGFGPASNQAARASRGALLCLLNPDTLVTTGWAAPLVERAGRPRVGAVTPLLVSPGGGRVGEAGGVITSDGLSHAIGPGGWDVAGSVTTARVVDYASAACLVVRHDAFDAVDGFDPRYRLAYFEDADLAFSLAARGMRIWFDPRSEVVHLGGGTDVGDTARRLAGENHPRFVAKWTDELSSRPTEPPPTDGATRLALRDWKVSERVLVVADATGDHTTIAQRWRAGVPDGMITVAVPPGSAPRSSDAEVDWAEVDDPDRWLRDRADHEDVVVFGGRVDAGWAAAQRRWQPAALTVDHDVEPADVISAVRSGGRSGRYRWPT